VRGAFTAPVSLRRSFLRSNLQTAFFQPLSFSGAGWLLYLSFATSPWTSKEARKSFVKQWSLLFFFHQACGQRFTEEVSFHTNGRYGPHGIHALTERNPQTSSPQGINETESDITHKSSQLSAISSQPDTRS
jgi:hypothetical protein